MFERFTDRARRVVVLAQEEARMLNHNYIGTEHILLGLIHEGEGVAAKALESLGISLEGVRAQVEEIIGQGQQAPSGHIPFTPRAKNIGVKRIFCLTFETKFFGSHGFEVIEGTPVEPEIYAELLRSYDAGVAEFLDLESVKPNTLGNTRMLKKL